MAETTNGNGRNGRLNGSTAKWIAIIIATAAAVLGWAQNYGLEAEVSRNCQTIKENANTITELREARAGDSATLRSIDKRLEAIERMLQER